MGDKSAIAWTEATWNPVVGCSIHSPGCNRCYAMKEAHRLANQYGTEKYKGLTTVSRAGQILWNGVVRLHPPHLDQPLKWGRPRLIFVNSMSDLFHESLSFADIDKVVAVMAQSMVRGHIFQVLTKRADVMRRYLSHPETPERVACASAELMTARMGANGGKGVRPARTPEHLRFSFPLRNVWWGISAEDQERFDERWPDFAKTPADKKFISYEPAIGPLSVRSAIHQIPPLGDSRTGHDGGPFSQIDWLIIGGESAEPGDTARPFHLEWAESLIAQCRPAGIKVYTKQLGSSPRLAGVPYAPRGIKLHRKGTDPLQWPERLRVREYPEIASVLLTGALPKALEARA